MDFDFLGIAAIPAITVICYLIGELVKLSPINEKWVPVCCGVSGGILGVVAQYTMETFPAHDILNAIAIGIVSGLAATGVNQVFKQLFVKN